MIPLFLLLMFQPTPGTVTVTSTVVATAGEVVCTMSLANEIVHVDCNVGSVQHVHVSDNKPVPGNVSGYVGSLQSGADNITWMVKQAATGDPISWQVSANGIFKSGVF